jgi:hypothetical protein
MIYQHYKGGKYKIIAEAKDSETLADLIVYQNIKTGETWARPKEMFFGKVEWEGKMMDRFILLEDV